MTVDKQVGSLIDWYNVQVRPETKWDYHTC